MNAASPLAEVDPSSVAREKQSPGFGQIFLTSVITAVVTAGVGLWGQDRAAEWSDLRQQRTKEVTEFVDAAQKFDGLVAAYVGELNTGGDTAQERAALQENLQQQFNLLETAKTNLGVRQTERAGRYQAELANLGDQLNRDLAAPDAKPIVQAIATTRAANVCVVYDLRKEANLPVVVSDQQRCEG